ncbi:MAG: hypothetical protein E7508_05740 [Ruminococcus sp.]|nr:hypothetical protein [Ruminococcus sp.]
MSKKSLEKEFFKFESFGQAFSKACGVEGQRHSSPSADGEIPCLSGAFTRGELKNSPVGCFLRGDALQEKASPYYLSSLFKSADLIGTKINIKVFLQAELLNRICSAVLLLNYIFFSCSFSEKNNPKNA